MIYNENLRKYLENREFSNGLKVPVHHRHQGALYRNDYLLELACGEKIIHIGFLDYIPLIEKKIAKRQWLHRRLRDVS